MIRARCFASGAALTQDVATLLAKACSEPIHEPHAVMLAGGTTPMAAYALLAASHPAVSPTLRLLFSDDRHVPQDNPKSNYGNVLHLLRALEMPADRVMRVWGELALSEATARYDRELDDFLRAGGRITVGLLGLGADGHTASLFTKTDVQSDAARWAISVQRPDGLDGISVTPALLRRVERLVFVVAGADKRAAAGRLVRQPDSIAAGLAVRGHPSVELWTDPDAWPFEAAP